jgi:very-short-patch-repair endonuclease
MKTILYNQSSQLEFRRLLRKRATPAEKLLWSSLRNRQLDGRKFKRQYGIGNYVLDFYCPSERLCIELDGAPHFSIEGMERDRKKDEFLEEKKIKVIRIENQHIFDKHEHMLEFIRLHFKK